MPFGNAWSSQAPQNIFFACKAGQILRHRRLEARERHCRASLPLIGRGSETPQQQRRPNVRRASCHFVTLPPSDRKAGQAHSLRARCTLCSDQTAWSRRASWAFAVQLSPDSRRKSDSDERADLYIIMWLTLQSTQPKSLASAP